MSSPRGDGGLDFAPWVPVVDANVGVGHPYNRPAPFDNPRQLREQMQRNGVERAVVYHVLGESLDTVHANDLLATWTEANDGLIPQWIVGPDAADRHQLEQLHRAGQVLSVRLHDFAVTRVPFVDWVYGDLLEWLQSEAIPLWLSLAETWASDLRSFVPTPVADVVAVLRQFPQLVTVLLGATYNHSQVVRPLLRALPNAHLELSRYEGLGEIEGLVGEFGAHRFIYGSYYPRYAMGPMLYYIHHAGLSIEDLEAICAGNVRRLIGEIAR